MNPWLRRLVFLLLALLGLWTVRRVMIERAERAQRRTRGAGPRLAAGPAAVPIGADGPVAALSSGSTVPDLDLAALDRATSAAARDTQTAKPPPAPAPPAVAPAPPAVAPASPAVAPAPPAPGLAPFSEASGTEPPSPGAEPEPAAPVADAPAQQARAEPTSKDQPPPAARSHVTNLDEVRERLASIRVDAPSGTAAPEGRQFRGGETATARSRRPRRSEPWRQPAEDGTCPPRFPVKAKLRSRLFHLPGMLAYDRTHADRCYRSSAAAEDDGFRQAKR